MIKFWAGAFVILCVLSWRPAVFVAVDDPPTASLAELLMLYQDLGLPLPPKSAKLVRYESRAGGFMNGVRQPPQYSLAFLIEPNGDQKEMALLSGTNLFERWKPPQWRVIGPTATAALETPGFRSDISLAIQCQALGWNELAADILVRSQRNQSDPPKKQIVFHAWNYWTSQMMKPAVDRKPILSMLKKLKAIDPERAAQFKADSVIRSLELALAPSTAKPGSIEALIDQLVEATDEGWPLEEERNSTPYQKLVRLGFDAVPALVVYLDDTRLTCATYSGRVRNASREVLVGDIVGDILKELAGSEAAQEWRTRIVDDSGSREPLVKSDILAWWREAQKIGEEAYLVKHATDLEIDRYARHTLRQPRQNRLEIVAQKYPRNLEKIYRAILDKQSLMESDSMVSAIESSTLTADEKVRLLVVGATHKNLQHRRASLGTLMKLDRQQFAEILIKTLDGFSGKPTERYWTCPESALAYLVVEADNEGAWQALERLAKKADVGLRMEILSNCEYSKSQSTRRLEFLAAFLADKEDRDAAANVKLFQVPYAFHGFPKLEVRNGAACVIGRILDFKNPPNAKWQAKDWAEFREQVRNGLRVKGIEVPDR